MPTPNFTQSTPPTVITDVERRVIFEHFSRRLARFRNTALLYAQAEHPSHPANSALNGPSTKEHQFLQSCQDQVNVWANSLLRDGWAACNEPGGGAMTSLACRVMF